MYCLGIMASVPFGTIYRKHKGIAFLLLIIFLNPLSAALTIRSCFDTRTISDPIWEDGTVLRHQDPQADALYTFIRTQTPPDAIVMDTYLTIPILGQRELLVGMDDRRNTFFHPTLDGWAYKASLLLEKVSGHPKKVINLRKRILWAFYGDPCAPDNKKFHDALGKIVGHREVLIIARTPEQICALERCERFELVFESLAGKVYVWKR